MLYASGSDVLAKPAVSKSSHDIDLALRIFLAGCEKSIPPNCSHLSARCSRWDK